MGKTPNGARLSSGMSGVFAYISVISWSISKIQKPAWRVRHGDSNEPSHISTAPTKNI